MAVTAPPPRKYNPGFLTDDELVASFCVRTSELESIVEMLRECTGSSNPHQIVIGPRGSGKTSLLLRVAAEVRRDAGLSSAFFPVVFAEESYGVATAGEFWLECLSRLADQARQREGGPDLHLTVEDLRTIRDDRTLAERCFAALLDFSDREGKRLVLMVENLNMMFGDMADSREAGWRLRQTLQTEPRIILLASATNRFDEIDDPDRALYDLFRTLTLRPLDTNECAVLWEAVSGRHHPPETIRSLEILTGGSPRLLAIVARFGAGLSFRELMADLLDLVDDHTEYFKSHLESLPAQERRVYLALADLWKPALTKEIADRARLETSRCSAQLTRLVERGAVQVAGGTARRKQYYLSERLYNIYYLLRRNRGPDRLIEALIRFMASYYSPTELKDIGIRIAREAGSFDAEMRSLHHDALRRLIDLPAVAGYREELLATIPQGFTDASDRGPALPEVARTAPDGSIPAHHRAGQPDGELEEALTTYDEVLRRFGESETPAFLEQVAKALVNMGSTLIQLNRPEEALDTCDEVLRRFGDSEMPTLLEEVAKALVRKGFTLIQLNRLEEALDTCDEVLRRFGESETPAFLEQVAKALVNMGNTLIQLNRLEEALDTCDEVLRRFGDGETPTLSKPVVVALVNMGFILIQLNRLEEALDTCDEVLRRFGDGETPTPCEPIAKAPVNIGGFLIHKNPSEEQPDVWEEVGLQSSGSESLIAMALCNKGDTLVKLDRSAEALDAWDEAVRRFGDSESLILRKMIGIMLLRKAELEFNSERYDAAIETVDRMLDRHLTDSLAPRRQGHLIRARAALARGDSSACEQDIQALLGLLPELDPLPGESIHELTAFSIMLGPKRMCELIKASPSVELLLPLTTALEWELGLQPRVAREVEEVAEDIRRDLAKLKEARTNGAT